MLTDDSALKVKGKPNVMPVRRGLRFVCGLLHSRRLQDFGAQSAPILISTHTFNSRVHLQEGRVYAHISRDSSPFLSHFLLFILKNILHYETTAMPSSMLAPHPSKQMARYQHHNPALVDYSTNIDLYQTGWIGKDKRRT